jgi:ubiquinone/menaquinone biosynthesis C-methylase UbiE
MTTEPGSPDRDNKYPITDSEAELARLVEQERVISKALGGLLPEHANQAAFVAPMQRVLDVTCGSGGWVLGMAQTYPHLQVMGFDIDTNMISYATTQAKVGKLEHASFRVMNALDPLDYPDNFFDLVNARYLSVIGCSAWPQVTQELFRITRPGGFIRLTETEDISVTTSPAFEKMMVIACKAIKQGGFSFSPTGRSLGYPPRLPYFLRNAGCHNIQKHASIIDWSAGTEVHDAVAQDLKIFFRLLQPFMVNVGAATEEEMEQLHRDIDIELRAEDFCAFWTFYTIWGQKPL